MTGYFRGRSVSIAVLCHSSMDLIDQWHVLLTKRIDLSVTRSIDQWNVPLINGRSMHPSFDLFRISSDLKFSMVKTINC